jgi:Tol biopolymer transport system component
MTTDLAAQSTATQRTAEAALEAARLKETLDGDLAAAIAGYKEVASTYRAIPDVAAHAAMLLAAAYEQLGQTASARSEYERVMKEFPDQGTAANTARTRLARGASAQTSGRAAQQIWTGRQVNLEGRPSPDGRFIPFADWQGGTANLAVRELKTGAIRRLTSDATGVAWAENPVPSPAGRRIAYRWGEDNSTIRIIDEDGTNMRILLHDLHDHYLSAWSPDGQYLLAMHEGPDRPSTIVRISASDGTVTPVKPMGDRRVALGDISPDGRFFVYALNGDGQTGSGGVFAISPDGTQETPLVEGAAAFGTPLWTPDGQHVVFPSTRSGQRDLWAIRVVDGRPADEPALVQPNVGTLEPLGFTGDGTLYYGVQQNQVEAYTAPFDAQTLTTGSPVRVTDHAVGNNSAPEIAPDGSSIAFVRRGAPGESQVVIKSAGGQERVLTTLRPGGSGGGRKLAWFPDGLALLAEDYVAGRRRFRKVDVASGTATTIFEGPATVWIGALSADGKSLFYSVKEGGDTLILVQRDIETGAQVELFRRTDPPQGDGTGLFGLTASPDGRSLAFAVNTTGYGRTLMVMPTDGGHPREILHSSNTQSILPQGAMAWTSDSRYLVYSGRCDPGMGNDEQQLCAIPVAGGTPQPLAIRMQAMPSRMVSADGRFVAFTGRTIDRELWAIRNLLAN